MKITLEQILEDRNSWLYELYVGYYSYYTDCLRGRYMAQDKRERLIQKETVEVINKAFKELNKEVV